MIERRISLVEEITIRCTDCPERRVFIWFWHLVIDRPDRIERRVPEGKGFCRRGLPHIGGSRPIVAFELWMYKIVRDRSRQTDWSFEWRFVGNHADLARKFRLVKVRDYLANDCSPQWFEWLRRGRLTDISLEKIAFSSNVDQRWLQFIFGSNNFWWYLSPPSLLNFNLQVLLVY